MRDAAPVASLPMYDWPEVAWANDTLWSALAERLVNSGVSAPAALDRERHPNSVWRDRGLVVSQTCGLPFSTRLRGIVRLVATPVYNVPGCEGPLYSSMIVVRASETAEELSLLRGRRFAFTRADSLSGNVALRSAMKEGGVDPARADWVETGSHRASVRAVAEEAADVAAIDAICWSLALRYEPAAAARLKVIGTTALRSGLPLITAGERRDNQVGTIRAVLKETLADPLMRAVREALQITGIRVMDEWDYLPIASLERQVA